MFYWGKKKKKNQFPLIGAVVSQNVMITHEMISIASLIVLELENFSTKCIKYFTY